MFRNRLAVGLLCLGVVLLNEIERAQLVPSREVTGVSINNPLKKRDCLFIVLVLSCLAGLFESGDVLPGPLISVGCRNNTRLCGGRQVCRLEFDILLLIRFYGRGEI